MQYMMSYMISLWCHTFHYTRCHTWHCIWCHIAVIYGFIHDFLMMSCMALSCHTCHYTCHYTWCHTWHCTWCHTWHCALCHTWHYTWCHIFLNQVHSVLCYICCMLNHFINITEMSTITDSPDQFHLVQPHFLGRKLTLFVRFLRFLFWFLNCYLNRGRCFCIWFTRLNFNFHFHLQQ